MMGAVCIFFAVLTTLSLGLSGATFWAYLFGSREFCGFGAIIAVLMLFVLLYCLDLVEHKIHERRVALKKHKPDQVI